MSDPELAAGHGPKGETVDATLARDLAAAARAMAGQRGLQSTLDTICARAVAAVGADACGIFLLRQRSVQSAAMSSPDLHCAEQAQIAAGEGPCLDALRHSRITHVPDLRADGRWPRWAPRMVELGWLSVLSLPLAEHERTVGSLNLVNRTPGRFSDAAVEAAELFADHACVALAAARAEGSLTEAINSRHAIGLAQGILMERYGLDLDRAFESMRRSSQDGNIKLRSVAEHVVQHRRLPGAEDTVRR